jgi:glycosyltransferase involved in cell wall biosynthesis
MSSPGGLRAGPGTSAKPRRTGLCFVVPELDRIGGYELAAVAQAKALAERGLSVLLVTQQTRAAPLWEDEPNLSIIRLEQRWKRLLVELAFRLSALLVGRRGNLAAIHCQTFSETSAIAVIVGRALGLPVVVRVATEEDVREFHAARDWKSRILFATLRRASVFVAVSSAIRDELYELGFPRDRVVLRPNGVDVDRFRPASPWERAESRRTLGLPADRALIGCVGRLVERKGIDVLIRALATLLRASHAVDLCVVGDGPLRAELEALARTLGVAERITWAGEQSDVKPWLAAFDLFCFPSRLEGSPNALLEAMATALPVVASRIGGVVDCVEPERSGVLVPPDDPESLAAAIERLMRNPGTCRELGERARERVVERFSLADVTTLLIATYDALREERRLAPGACEAAPAPVRAERRQARSK